MLSKSLQDGINEQIRAEFQSAYLYLAMASFCESQNLPGMAKWLRLQWQEEQEHGMKLYDYVFSRGGQVTLGAIDKPAVKYRSALDVFQQVLAHEQKVTALINKLYELALREKDYATQVALQWFIAEQVEEEKTAAGIIAQLDLVGDSGSGVALIDRALGARVRG
jgi:ferritin